jgi:TatA/E family protein of Tat protein translocase
MSAPGFGEIIVILIVALIVFGPRKLPEMARSLGKSVREFRRASSSLRAELEEGLDIDERPSSERRNIRRRTRHPRAVDNGESSADPTPEGGEGEEAPEPADPAERRTGDGPD